MSNTQLIVAFVAVIIALPFVALFVMKFSAFGWRSGIQLFEETKKERDDDGEKG